MLGKLATVDDVRRPRWKLEHQIPGSSPLNPGDKYVGSRQDHHLLVGGPGSPTGQVDKKKTMNSESVSHRDGTGVLEYIFLFLFLFLTVGKSTHFNASWVMGN